MTEPDEFIELKFPRKKRYVQITTAHTIELDGELYRVHSATHNFSDDTITFETTLLPPVTEVKIKHLMSRRLCVHKRLKWEDIK